MKNEASETVIQGELLAPETAAERSSAAGLDVDKYRKHLASLSLSREQEDALLKALWSTMASFVDLGFGLDPVQSLFRDAAEDSSTADPITLRLGEESRVRSDFHQVVEDTTSKEQPQ